MFAGLGRFIFVKSVGAFFADIILTFMLMFIAVLFAFTYSGAVGFYGLELMTKIALGISIGYTVLKYAAKAVFDNE